MGGGPWAIKSVTLNGDDLTDTPLDIAKSGDISGVEIVISDKQTTFSGTVRNARGEFSKDYTVAIFPDRLKEGALPMRFIRIVRPDQQGRFETRGLPPGDYLAVAVEALEQGEQWDPAFRKRVEPTAKRFRLTEGQTITVDLQLHLNSLRHMLTFSSRPWPPPFSCIATTAVATAQQPGPGPFGRGGQMPFPGGRFGGMPPRDDPQPATGTAKITGRVVSAETGAPMRRAQIRITSPDARTNRDVDDRRRRPV